MQGRRVIREDSFKTAGDVNDVFLLFSPSTNFHISAARMRRLSRRENLFATRVRLTAVEITSPRCIYIICLSAAENGNIMRHPWQLSVNEVVDRRRTISQKDTRFAAHSGERNERI